jgi:hypothetical protein
VIRFCIRLRPVTDVEPWGSDNPHLHWFGLTDGWYWIELEGHELLRYSDQTVRRWGQAGDEVPHPYVDYQVVRLWEDIIELTPAVLEPVPAQCQELIRSDRRDWTEVATPEAAAAAAWYDDHVQYMSYLHNGPHIRWWRTVHDSDDHVTIAWLHQPTSEIEFAGARQGERTVPTTVFIAAVRELDRALLTAMDERITQLERDGPPPGVSIDLPRLRAEHLDRETWLERRMIADRDTDWAAVRTGTTQLLG